VAFVAVASLYKRFWPVHSCLIEYWKQTIIFHAADAFRAWPRRQVPLPGAFLFWMTVRRLPPLNALQTFEVVARHRSFTRAASQLYLTQGAVSRQIQALEEHFGFALFTRHAKGLSLTAHAERLLPTVQDCFERLEDVSLSLKQQRTGLALKVPTCLMRWILPQVMQFQAAFPDVELQVTTSWRHDVDFQTESFDAAIVYGQSAGAGVHAMTLFEERLIPVCSPALLQSKPLDSLSDLTAHTLLHPTRDHRDWRQWLQQANVTDVDASLGQSFESLDVATNAAIQGFGVAISDCRLIREDVLTQRLVTPLDMAFESGYRYYFVHPDGVAQTQKITQFRDWLRERQPQW
jgi:LysR family glycine cleavage system transcriptional activator